VPKRKPIRTEWESDWELDGRVNTDLPFEDALDVLLNTEIPDTSDE
jgi:hypothetical protein